MKIICKCPVITDSDLEVVKTRHPKIIKTETGCDIYMINGGDDSYVYKISESEIEQNTSFDLYWSINNKVFVESHDSHASRDQDFFLRFNYACNDGIILNIVKTEKDLYIISTPSCYVVGFDVSIQENKNLSSQKCIDVFEPGFAKSDWMLSRFHKTTLIRDINILESVSDLEKQVDLLSELVLMLIDKSPNPDWIEDFRDMIKTHKSTQFKSEKEAIKDIVDTKNHIRTKQKEYHKAIGK